MGLIADFIRLSRPHFLAGGALMYGIGVASGGGVTVARYLLGQLMVTAAQITAHYVNEYSDIEPDRLVRNRTLFSGGSGVLANGGFAPAIALRAARIASVFSVLAAGAVWSISPVAALLGVTALMISWTYSIPPVRILDTGWGELVTSIVVTVLVPLIGVSMTEMSPSPELVWAMAVLLPVHVAMMLVFEIPDADSDRRAGKNVLSVRLGESATLVVIVGLYVASAMVALIGRPDSVDVYRVLSVAPIPLVGVGLMLNSIARRSFGWATALAVSVLAALGLALLVLFVGRI